MAVKIKSIPRPIIEKIQIKADDNNKGKILVAGYSGFIGSYLVPELIKNNHSVVGVSRGSKPQMMFDKKHFKHYTCDISDIKTLEDISKKEKITEIIHLAGGGGNQACLADPKKSVLIDIYGTLNLVTLAARNNIRIIFTSSYLAYSVLKKRALPFTEEMELQPDDFYGALKKIAEEIVKTSPNYIILRLSHIYGYDKRMSSLFLKMIESAKKQSKIGIKGSGNQKFDLLYVEDLCKAIVLILNSAIKNQILNIGSGSHVSINELALTIKGVLNENIKIENIKDPCFVEYPDHYVSIDKIKKLLKWKPEITLEEGITNTLKRFNISVE